MPSPRLSRRPGWSIRGLALGDGSSTRTRHCGWQYQCSEPRSRAAGPSHPPSQRRGEDQSRRSAGKHRPPPPQRLSPRPDESCQIRRRRHQGPAERQTNPGGAAGARSQPCLQESQGLKHEQQLLSRLSDRHGNAMGRPASIHCLATAATARRLDSLPSLICLL